VGHVPRHPWQGEASIAPSTQPFVVAETDIVIIYTILIYLAAFAMLGVFAKFTLNLIKQHNDIYPLLYAMEDAEKKKERGEN
jgi:hypothetical protein